MTTETSLLENSDKNQLEKDEYNLKNISGSNGNDNEHKKN